MWALSLCTRLLTVDGDGAAADAERLAILQVIHLRAPASSCSIRK